MVAKKNEVFLPPGKILKKSRLIGKNGGKGRFSSRVSSVSVEKKLSKQTRKKLNRRKILSETVARREIE